MGGIAGEIRKMWRAGAIAALALSSPLLQGGTDFASNLDSRLLAAHNRERASLGIQPLTWNEGLARDAAAWGRYLSRLGYLKHSPDNPNDPDPQGENLWAGTRGYYTPENMVGLWVSEKRFFKAGIFPDNSRTARLEDIAHYTQVMWRSSTDVGCAVVRGRYDDFLVCRYSEGGNVLGERPF